MHSVYNHVIRKLAIAWAVAKVMALACAHLGHHRRVTDHNLACLYVVTVLRLATKEFVIFSTGGVELAG